ncbi:MAG: UDP-N-acetylmuramate dehydrogenase [Patescibacteria group bacterium]|nr:UDP-N-acetylmuramate dehydrogenase [Patescibacteria group bacterium]
MNKFFDKCQKNVKLSEHTTFKIGGFADYFFVAKNKDDLIEAIKVAKEEDVKYYILGGGSNVLVSDDGFRGLVIKIEIADLNLKDNILNVGAGVAIGKIVSLALDNSLTGVEFWTGVPGTIGGAIFGNAGAYGKDAKDVLKSVTYYDATENKIIEKENSKLSFSYRSSEFKNDKKKIVLSCEIKLKKDDKKKIIVEMSDIAKQRSSKIPMEPSAGSVFKNVNENLDQVLGKLDIEQKEKDKFKQYGKIPVALLIEKSGLKGKQVGGVKISEKHANFIVNIGGAKAKDVLRLVEIVKTSVKEKFDVELELENILVGF